MNKKSVLIPAKLKPWIDARKRFHLSHAHVQMARELGLNPKKFGKMANHHQEPWKLSLPDFILKMYFKRFGKCAPDDARSIEHKAAEKAASKRAKKLSKAESRSSIASRGGHTAERTPS